MINVFFQVLLACPDYPVLKVKAVALDNLDIQVQRVNQDAICLVNLALLASLVLKVILVSLVFLAPPALKVHQELLVFPEKRD